MRYGPTNELSMSTLIRFGNSLFRQTSDKPTDGSFVIDLRNNTSGQITMIIKDYWVAIRDNYGSVEVGVPIHKVRKLIPFIMTKAEFKEVAQSKGVTVHAYSGKRKTMYIKGGDSAVVNFIQFLKNGFNVPFNVVAA